MFLIELILNWSDFERGYQDGKPYPKEIDK